MARALLRNAFCKSIVDVDICFMRNRVLEEWMAQQEKAAEDTAQDPNPSPSASSPTVCGYVIHN